MWSCPYCGNHHGMLFEDQHMTGILCLHPDCGRVDEMDREKLMEYPNLFFETDL